MKKVAIVYWSSTGNTETMANSVAEGVKSVGGEVSIFTATEFTSDMAENFDAIAFGCPAMGAEVLEESEFEPMYQDCKSKLKGKQIGLFGSYGWGDGEWMRNWEEDVLSAGGLMISDSVICNDAPDEAAEHECVALGQSLAK